MITQEDINAMTELDFDNYQRQAVTTAIYPSTAQVIYPAMGLANEAGEVLGKVKKIIRDGKFDRDDIADEIGDVLWYAAALARDLNTDLSTIAKRNLAKLASRQQRGTLQGSGDKR